MIKHRKDNKIQCELLFSVSDSGCGIEKKRKMNLFELFSNAKIDDYNLDTTKELIDSSKLMGMGLAYCHKILLKMNSKLEMSTAIDVGSTFSFKIMAEIQLVS